MTKDLNVLLDECIDRINRGESLEKCLISYPEYAEQLEPLLVAMCDLRDTCSTIPGATARSAVRRRLDAALLNSEKSLRKPRRRPAPLFGWARVLATVTATLAVVLVGFGIYWMQAPGTAPVVAQDNFRLLLSDEKNDIGDFESLNIWVTSIGLLPGGESGSWMEFEPAVKSVDLTLLQGDNALEIWSGQIPDGRYTKVFIYVDHVTGVLKGTGEVVIVKLPSGKLQLSMPFEVGADSLVNFVYDLTVVGVGNEQSGVSYILKPQIDQSGTGHEVNEVLPGKVEIKGLIEDFDLDQGWIKIEGYYEGPIAIDENTEIEGTLEVGLVAEVEAVVQLDDSLLATEIEVKVEEEEGASEVKLSGVIEGFNLVDGEGWVEILGWEIAIDENTEIEGTLEVGLMAEVEAVVQPDDSLLATEIEVKEEKEEGASEVELSGVITAFNLVDGEGWIKIEGYEDPIAIDENTEIEGTLEVGLMAEVEAVVQPDVSLLATEIEIEEEEEEKASEVELSGVITAFNLVIEAFNLVDGSGWIEIAGYYEGPIAIDENTEIEGTLEVGLMAEVEAVVQPDDSLLATEIKVEEEEEEKASEVELSGVIVAFNLVDGEGWIEIEGYYEDPIAIDENTEIEGTLEVGLVAEVEAVVQPDDSLLATEIKVE